MARRLQVTIKPRAKIEAIAQLSADHFIVTVHPPARDGKANARLIELLADHFVTAKSKIRILHGHTSRKKLIEVG